jgi:hypothetical protein
MIHAWTVDVGNLRARCGASPPAEWGSFGEERTIYDLEHGATMPTTDCPECLATLPETHLLGRVLSWWQWLTGRRDPRVF